MVGRVSRLVGAKIPNLLEPPALDHVLTENMKRFELLRSINTDQWVECKTNSYHDCKVDKVEREGCEDFLCLV